jgi:hypothetical protein
MPNYTTILEFIPLVISIWSGLTLAWGVYVGVWFDNLLTSSTSESQREEDQAYILFIWGANIMIFLLGFVVPIATPSIRGSIGDAVLVLNVFYTSFLIFCTVLLARWSMSKAPLQLEQLPNIE